MEKKNKSIIVFIVMPIIEIVRTLFLIPHGVCKYHPSCTAYTKDALLTLPLHKAMYFIIKRIVRCNPFTRGGYDPLVEKE